MSDRKRLHRDEPARIGPVRDFSKLYHRAETMNGAKPAKPAARDTPRREAARGGPMAEGVELAYSVIEKYMAEGRRTAEELSTEPYTARAATDNLQNILERLLRFQAEILPLWVETLATLVKVDPSGSAFAAAPAAWPRPNGGPNTATMPVSIEVVSRRPAQVSVEVRPNSEVKFLVALELNAVDSRKPALKDISFVPDNVRGGARLRIRIPETQPAGTYSGVIVNRESGETRGTLSIRLAD
jgi:hypothetical protein